MSLTYRQLILRLQETALTHGDKILDLPAKASCGGEDAMITGVDYQPHEAATDKHDEEPEGLYMWTDWD